MIQMSFPLPTPFDGRRINAITDTTLIGVYTSNITDLINGEQRVANFEKGAMWGKLNMQFRRCEERNNSNGG